MKIIVGLDSDGHFVASLLNDRKNVRKVLKSISDGDIFSEIEDEYGTKDIEEAFSNSDEIFESFILNFTQRGTLEIIEISVY